MPTFAIARRCVRSYFWKRRKQRKHRFEYSNSIPLDYSVYMQNVGEKVTFSSFIEGRFPLSLWGSSLVFLLIFFTLLSYLQPVWLSCWISWPSTHRTLWYWILARDMGKNPEPKVDKVRAKAGQRRRNGWWLGKRNEREDKNEETEKPRKKGKNTLRGLFGEWQQPQNQWPSMS